MAIAKRIFLFLAVNLLILLTISFITSFFGLQPYLQANGLNYQALMIFCLLWGMVGSFISLLLSRFMAKRMMGVQVIDPNTQDAELQQLVQTVHHLARSAGLPKMPEVGIYQSPEVNAFATGPSKSRSLVAVSTGLLNRMKADEVEGVLGHEIAHIANGDMVTLTLIQGVVNAFVMFLARVAAFAITQALRSRNDNDSPAVGGFAYYMTTFVMEIFFGILGTIVVAWFSRYREFKADAGGARLAGRDKMIAALQRLQQTFEIQDPHAESVEALKAFKISGHSRLALLFSTHPPLAVRIERLSRAI